MKQRVIVPLVLIGLLLGASVIMAQTTKEDESVITYSTNFINFLRSTTTEMGKDLEQARKSHDTRRTNCVASRLVDLKKILGESEAVYKNLREAAFEKKPSKIREEFTKVRKNQAVVEQIVKLVNECYGKIGAPGGFTETVEQFLGSDFTPLPPGFGAHFREDMPEPRPPQYEPEPTSQSEEE